ncbi:MAG: UDP-2,3-diacylglucosamine diphosphatase [Cellvibrionaceae bacterium]
MNQVLPFTNERKAFTECFTRSPEGGSTKENRTICISDVHLGTKDCKAEQLDYFLKKHDCDTLYLVGDIVDGWQISKKIHWDRSYTKLVRRLLKLAKSGTTIYYITGNHDEFLRRFTNNNFDNIHILNRHVYHNADHRKLLILHGDQFDGVARCHGLLKFVGDKGYDVLMGLSRLYNRIRHAFGHDYWSLSSFVKQRIPRANRYIHDYEHGAALACKKQGYDGIVCGHIHHPAIKKIEGVDYYNTGDWVESCTALMEDQVGNITLKYWFKEPKQQNKDFVQKNREARVA